MIRLFFDLRTVGETEALEDRCKGKAKEHNVKVARLDFEGAYLPSLSINYVAMSKDMGKRLPQLYYIKMKILRIWVLLQSESSWQRNDAIEELCHNRGNYGRYKLP